MIRTLLRPGLLSSLNRWKKKNSKGNSREIIAAGLALITIIAAFFGTDWLLIQLRQASKIIYVAPALPLGLIFSALFLMSCFSAIVTAISTLFYANDLELWLTAPIKERDFFLSKFIQTAIGVIWMPLIFIVPVLAAFFVNYEAKFSAVIICLVAMIPYFLLPIALGFSVAVLTIALVDQRLTRTLSFIVAGLLLFGAYSAIQSISVAVNRQTQDLQLVQVVSLLKFSESWWFPASWAAITVSEALLGQFNVKLIAASYLALLGAIAVSFGIFTALYEIGFNRSRQSSLKITINAKQITEYTQSSPHFALAKKEWFSIVRDLSQSTQVAFLGCICIIYLVNVRFLVSVDGFPEETREHWRQIFFLFHTALAAFFTIALSTRLVFSSVSREGQAFWIIQTSPIDLKSLLKSKLLFWYPPIALLSLLLFSIGGYAVSERLDITALHSVVSLLVSWSIVATGIGLGAHFSDFNSEHPSQIALGFGSLIYMLIGIALVFINTLPSWYMLNTGYQDISVLEKALRIAPTLVLVGVLNTFVAVIALRAGRRALRVG